MTTESRWVPKSWAVVLVVGLGVVGFVTWRVFTKYAENLPYISNEHAAWGSFGSLLSAFITLAGFVITIATLLFLNSQNKVQKGFIDWQMKTQRFDWYLKHRQLFMERLRELQISFDGQIRFRTPEELYEGIYPENYLAMTGLTTKPKTSEEAGRLLDNTAVKLDSLAAATQRSQWDERTAMQVVVEFIDVSWDLHIEWVGDECDGDIQWNGRNTGINIYSIYETVSRLDALYNSLLYFAGRPAYEGFNRGPMGYLREALITAATDRFHPLIKITRNNPYLVTLESLLVEVSNVRQVNGSHLMVGTRNAILRALHTRADVAKLGTGDSVLNIYHLGYTEATYAMIDEEVVVDSENLQKLQKCLTVLGYLNDVMNFMWASEGRERPDRPVK